VPNQGCPEYVLRRVGAMVKGRTNVISAPRLASDREIEQMEVRGDRTRPGPVYIDEVVREVQGVGVT
jgi:hypothetical protein